MILTRLSKSTNSREENIKKKIRRHMFFEGWRGVESIPAKESICKHRIAARLATTQEWKYDCWVPDPDDDSCCLHMIIYEDDLMKRLLNGNVALFRDMECYISEFQDMPMADKLKHLTDVVDILEFYELEEVPEGVPLEKVRLVLKMTDDAIKVSTLDDLI